MKKLVLVTNDLPGSGKSTLSEVLVASLAADGLTVAHLATNCSDDADERFSPSPDITPWDFDDDRELNTILTSLDDSDALVIDVGTGDINDLHEIAEEAQFFEILGELSVELTLAIPLHGDADPTDTVIEIAEAFSDNADYVLVTDDTFPREIWKGSYARKVMTYLSAIEIAAPKANGALAKALGEHGHELHEAQAHREELPRSITTPLSKWERQYGGKLDAQARDFLFPETEEPASALIRGRSSKGAARVS